MKKMDTAAVAPRWRLWVVPALVVVAITALLVVTYLGQNAPPGSVVPVAEAVHSHSPGRWVSVWSGS